MELEGYPVEGLSIAGHETYIIFPSLSLAFDIGRCRKRSIFLSDRSKRSIFLPISQHLHDAENVQSDRSRREEFYMRKDLKVKAFRTYHAIQSQGYVVYTVKHNLKQEYLGLSGTEIKNLKSSGVEIKNTTVVSEVAFTGDTMSEFIVDEANIDALRAKILVMESTYVDDAKTVEHARHNGHTHLSEIVKHAEKFENKAILLMHFSARYAAEEIHDAVSKLQEPLAGRVFALTKGFNKRYMRRSQAED